MKKNINLVIATLLAVAGMISFTSCKEDEPEVAKAVLCSVFSLDFDADGGSEEVKVVSDAVWTVDAPEWITVVPTTGSGTTFVTITTNKNYNGANMMAPRKASVIFHGKTKASEAEVVVSQQGDGYIGLEPVDGAGVYSCAEDLNLIVKNMTVVAHYDGGFIATDGVTNVNAAAAEKPAVGATATLYGVRKSDKFGMAFVEVEKAEAGGTAAKVPEATDITQKVDDATIANTLQHVTLTGIYDASSSTISIDGMKNRGFVVNVTDGVDMKSMSSHFVKVDAYYLGTAAPVVNLIVAGFEDLGVAEVVYFLEDFEWLEPWSCQKPAGDTVGDNNSDATAQQLGTNKVDGVSTYQALLDKGYSFPVCCHSSKDPRKPEAQTYLQRNYVKFGLTGYYSGITFPKMKDIPEGANTVMCFDWSVQRQGGGNYDDTQLVIIVKNGTEETQFLVPPHDLKKDEAYRWIPVRIELGTTLTANSEVTIRNIDSQWPAPEAVALRFHLDNIKVIEK